jgi:hypothetical protein
MSVSTPRPIDRNRSLLESLRKAKQSAALGWGLSLLLHVGVCTAFLLLSLHQSPFHSQALPGSPGNSAGGAQNGGSSADSRAVETRRQTAELEQTQADLESLRARRQTQYDHWVQERTANAPRETTQALQTAAQAQRQAASAQAEAARMQQAASPVPTSPEESVQRAKKALRAVERARNAQAETLQAQIEAGANLEFVPPATPQLKQALTEARRKQTLAQDAQNKAEALLKQAVPLERQNRDAQAEATRLQKVYEAAKSDPQAAQKAQAALNQANTNAAALSQTLANLRQTLSPAQAAAQQAQAEALQAQQQAQELASRQIQVPLQTNTAPHPHVGGQEHGPEGNGGSGPLGSQTIGPDSPLPGSGPTKAAANPSQHPIPGTQMTEQPDAPGSPSSPLPVVPENRSLPDLYADAIASERRSAEAYRQIRAIDRAMIEGIPLERALQETEYTPPIRPALNASHSNALLDFLGGSTLEPTDIETARQQIAAMNALGHRLRDRVQAELGGGEQGATVRLDWVKRRAAQSAHLQALAQEDGQQAKDLTAALRGLPGGKTSPGFRTGQAKDRETQDRPASLPPPIPAGLDIKAVPGRKILPGAPASAWMYVDSWYTIGPFPNPQRANINRSFPPEQGIDLDAAYLGKDNRTIHWKFVQSAGPLIVPADPEEYGIYYAYTELWFDRPRDLWIAVGSDDKSTLWIDDRQVWISSDVLKGWHIDEGLRRVHFKQGLNRIVYRLENGWRGMGLSLVICLKSTP